MFQCPNLLRHSGLSHAELFGGGAKIPFRSNNKKRDELGEIDLRGLQHLSILTHTNPSRQAATKALRTNMQ